MLMTMPEAVPGLDSRSVADALGISYRQLDYAIRNVAALRKLPSMAGGSGSRRRFDVDTLRRLDIAASVAAAGPSTGSTNGSLWLQAAEAAMCGPLPPASGFAVLGADGRMTYRERLDAADFPVGPVGGVARYDLDASPLGLLLAA